MEIKKTWYDERELRRQVLQHFKDAQRRSFPPWRSGRDDYIYLGDGGWERKKHTHLE